MYTKQKLTPFLWFNEAAGEAMEFYVKVFNEAPYNGRNSRIVSIARYEKGIDAPQSTKME